MPDSPESTAANKTSMQGALLIAVPRLQDPNFQRMVVLMVHHSESGAFGIVLGPVSNATMTDLCPTLGISWDRADAPPIRYGGPCEPQRIWLIHGGPESLDETETVAPGIHLGSSVGLIEQLNRRPELPVMAFAGYAGWGPGQLETEVQQQSWLPGEASTELVFQTDPDEVWDAALRAMDLLPGMIVSGSGASA